MVMPHVLRLPINILNFFVDIVISLRFSRALVLNYIVLSSVEECDPKHNRKSALLLIKVIISWRLELEHLMSDITQY